MSLRDTYSLHEQIHTSVLREALSFESYVDPICYYNLYNECQQLRIEYMVPADYHLVTT